MTSSKTGQRHMFFAVAAGLAFLPGFVAVPAAAGEIPKDVQMLYRAFDFVESLPKGELRLAIVYDPAIERSAKDATRLQEVIAGGGRMGGGRRIVPVLVKLGELDTTRDFGACLLTRGLGAEAAKVAATSRDRKVLCSTFDVAQVEAGLCTLGVRTAPKVEIVVNRASADAAGITFDAAFKMLVTQL